MRAEQPPEFDGDRDPPVVAVFAPTPLLTIVVEELAGVPDVHVHAGGQGVWVSRMLVELAVDARLCAPIDGETGEVLSALVRAEGIGLHTSPAAGPNGCYIQDRRSGTREAWLTMPAHPIGRHQLDELYGAFLSQADESAVCVLTGPWSPDVLAADTYRRIATDVRALGRPFVADLSGQDLEAALAGGLTFLKVSEDELVDVGRLPHGATDGILVDAARSLCDAGAQHVAISRAERPTVALIDGAAVWARGPGLHAADHRGAGDSMTAGVAAGLARGLSMRDALRVGIGAGTVNVTRHGLATGRRHQIEQVLDRVRLEDHPPTEEHHAGTHHQR